MNILATTPAGKGNASLKVPESTRRHAEQRLGLPALGDSRATQVEAFKRFLKLETERLRMRHRAGLGGLETMLERTHQVDLLVSQVCRLAAAKMAPGAPRLLESISVIALGGYGRSELAPFSDIDLLFLHYASAGDWVRSFVEEAVRFLWDSGLTVGHSLRAVGETVEAAREDLHLRTALTEARAISGSRDLFGILMKELDAKLQADRKGTESYLAVLRQEMAERHGKFGRAVAVLEPNVKEGAGCLRDLHTLSWLGFARFGVRGLASLSSAGSLSPRESETLRRSANFLARVRNELHFSAGRKNDVLVLDLHEPVAEALGFEPRAGLLASEVFMREFYRRASALDAVCKDFLVRHFEPPRRGFLAGLRRRQWKGRFEARGGQLHPPMPGKPEGSEFLLEAFSLAQSERLSLSDKLKRSVHAKLALIDRAYRASEDVSSAFTRLLAQRGRVAPMLRAMHETGFLGRYIPEWARITFLVQHDHFHRFTVDEHTLKAIEALDGIALGTSDPAFPLGRVLDGVADVRPLYLGMLLHDIGKGMGGRHVATGIEITKKIVTRLKLPSEVADGALFLVGMHLEMSQISQQRDLSEAPLVESFARRMGSLERLDMLLLLTYADHCAVGPGIWNEWKGILLFDLYRRARAHLAGSPVEEGAGDAARAHAVEALQKEFPAAEVERHFSGLPERYLRTNGAERMIRHYRLTNRRGEARAALDWHDVPGESCTELTVTADDRPGLFASVAGTLTACGINILSVDLFSRDDAQVIDTFKLSESFGLGPVRPAKRQRVAAALEEALTGRLDVGEAVAAWFARNPRPAARVSGRAARAPSVRFDNETSGSATVVEVRAPDRPGLAFTLASTLARLGLDISFAKIATDRALALDVFYVTEGGGKLAPERLPLLEESLIESLSHLDQILSTSGAKKGKEAT